MRKFFMTIIGGSAILTLALGVAFAWSATAATGLQNAPTGGLSVATYNVQPTGNDLYPTGNPIAVLTGQIQNNTTANPGVNVYLTGGSITFNPSHPCADSGSVAITDGSQVAPGGSTGGGWTASLTMGTGAPDSCQNTTVPFTAVVNVLTP
jgi:hypothetical protein